MREMKERSTSQHMQPTSAGSECLHACLRLDLTPAPERACAVLHLTTRAQTGINGGKVVSIATIATIVIIVAELGAPDDVNAVLL